MDHRQHTSRPQAARQLRLDYEPPPLAPVRRRSRAQRQLLNELHQRPGRAAEVLALLRRSTATSADLLRVGGIRFGARLFELRQQGHVIERTDGPGALSTYRLVRP